MYRQPPSAQRKALTLRTWDMGDNHQTNDNEAIKMERIKVLMSSLLFQSILNFLYTFLLFIEANKVLFNITKR